MSEVDEAVNDYSRPGSRNHARVVVVGAGQAGFQVVTSLRDDGFAGTLTMIGDESDLPYQRPPLSKGYLQGTVAVETLALRPAKHYADRDVDLRLGTAVTAIDTARRTVTLGGADPGTLAYDHLVLATGSRPRPLDVPGADADGVVLLRTREDSDDLARRLAHARRAVVVGGGFIGLELAAVARAAGVHVTVVELAPRVLARVSTPATSAFFAGAHTARGTTIHCGAGVVGIVVADGRAVGVRLADGTVLDADVVVAGVGVVPAAELAAAAGLAVLDGAPGGIVVDELLRTSDPAVSAIGDCAAFPTADGRTVRLESVQNATDQARAVAARLTGTPAPYRAVAWFWSDQGDLRLQIAGLIDARDEVVLRGDPADGAYSAFCFAGGTLLGAESVGRAKDHLAVRRLLAAGRPLTPAQAADTEFDLAAHSKARNPEENS